MHYEFSRNSELYASLADTCREKGDLKKAAEYLLEALRLGENDELRLTLASVYSEMGQLEMSNAECFKLLAKDPSDSDSLFILSGNLAEKRNFRAAYFYFSRLDDNGLDLSDFFPIDEEEEFDDGSRGFKLVYSNGRRDCSDLTDRAEIHIALKDFKAAIKVLNSVPKNSTQYPWARKMLMYCHYMNEDYMSAIDIASELIKSDSEDIPLLSALYNIYVETGDKENAEKAVERLIEIKSADIDDLMKAAGCLMDAKRYGDVIIKLSEAADLYPYDDNLLLMLASAYHMSEKTDRAKSILRELINVYGDRTNAKYFMECINSKIKFDGGIYLGIPAALALKKVSELEKASTDSDAFEHNFIYHKEFRDAIRWRIKTSPDDDFSYMLITQIGLLRKAASTAFLEELLMLNEVSSEAKITALYYLLTLSRKKRISLLSEDYLRSIIPLENKSPVVMREAYAICEVNLSPLIGSYEEPLYKAFIQTAKKIEDQLSRMRSPEAFASLVVFTSKELNVSEDIKVIAGLFGASLPTLRKYLKYLENE